MTNTQKKTDEMKVDTITQGDCLELLRTLPDGCADMVLTDPPYGTTSAKFDTPFDLAAWWKEIWRIAKPGAAILTFGQEPFSSRMRMAGGKFRYDWIWEKDIGSGFLNVNKMPLRVHEVVSVFYSKLPTYNPQKWKGKAYGFKARRTQSENYSNVKCTDINNTDGVRYPRDVLFFVKPKHYYGERSFDEPCHPQQKPTALLEYFIRTYTDEGQLVVDPFMGSGSTAVAAIRTGRHFVGFEREDRWMEAAERRIREARGEVRNSH